ncbi:hypothetical protein FRC19_011622 [Serendipita sp. 401]|nr:hypothetical protein FRC19_011622 [Serendipita sp. 401]
MRFFSNYRGSFLTRYLSRRVKLPVSDRFDNEDRTITILDMEISALFSSCIPNRPWALCNLMGVVLQVTGMPPLSTTAGNEATISAPIIQTSSDGRTSTSESTHSTVSSPSTTSAALNFTTSSSSGIASHSNAFSVFLPETDQTNSGSDDSSGGVGQSSTGEGSRASNTSAVVGGALGSLALLLLISTGIWMWRRNMRRRQRHENVAPGEEQNDGMQQSVDNPELPEDVINRLADTIIARMPLSAVSRPARGSRPRLSQLGSDVTSPEQHEEVPPPPWRQSWDSSNHETGD